MNENERIEQAWKVLAMDRDDEKALEMFLEVAKDKTLSNIIRSNAYRGAGETIYKQGVLFVIYFLILKVNLRLTKNNF